jgi:hypothetical protein
VDLLRRLDVRHLLLAVPWVVVGISARSPIRDNSFLWHVRAGTAQLDAGRVLTEDPFSFTMLGEPWRTQSWLADLLYGVLERSSELRFVWLMVAILGVVMMVAVAAVVSERLKSPLRMAVFLIATAVLMSAYLNPRPAIFSFILLPLLVAADRDPRLRWTLPLLTWVWATLHGSWVIALAYVALQGIRRKRKAAVTDVGVMGVAALFTAHGLGVVEILWQFFQNRSALALISEWGHPNLISVGLAPLFLAIVYLGWAGMKGRLSPPDFWIIAPFLALGLSSDRAVPAGWQALAPFAAAALVDTPEKTRDREGSGLVNLVLLIMVAVTPFLVYPSVNLDPERFPIQAAARLTSDRVFHDDTAGGYLILQQWPGRKVFIDDRAELFGPLVGQFVDARVGRPIWQDIFDRHEIQEALLRVEDPLVEQLRAIGWHEGFADDHFVVMRLR